MFKYTKLTNYPVLDYKCNPKFAKLLITQLGGPNGELSAALRYFNQKFGMPDEIGKVLLNDIATEEFSHAEMISSMVNKLLKGVSIEDIKKYGLEEYYTEHGFNIYPIDTNGNPFNASYFAVTSDVYANLSEDMAAEEKARSVYERLMDLTDDKNMLTTLSFLRQREVVHFNRFKALYKHYKKINYKG